MEPAGASRVEVHLLGGLSVTIEGVPVRMPSGAPATATALIALRRAMHVEEVVETLWPEAPAGVGRRRLRNVLARIRAVAGTLIVRHGDALVLARDVWVDHHALEDKARAALALPRGPERSAAVAEALTLDRGPLLPEALYEAWTDQDRARAEERREELEAALAGS